MKLVRVVLFLPWGSREDWRPCLEKAAERKYACEATSSYLLMELEEGKCFVPRRFTGQFSQYPLLSNSDTKLFGNLDIWRFIEVGEVENRAGIPEQVLCDSYVYFCENMKRVERFLQISAFEESEQDNVLDNGFNCRYNEGVLRGIPLPLPGDLECYSRKEEERKAVFHHGTKCKTTEWDVIWHWGKDTIEPDFGCANVFSSINFLNRRNEMKTTIIVIPDELRHVSWEAGRMSLRFDSREGTERVQTIRSSNFLEELHVCLRCLPSDLVQGLDKGDSVFVHTEAGVNVSALRTVYPKCIGRFFSIRERYPDDTNASQQTINLIRLLNDTTRNPPENFRAVNNHMSDLRTDRYDGWIHFDESGNVL